MALPPPDICELIRAHFILLGLPGWTEEQRAQLLKLLTEQGLSWSSLPEVLLTTTNLSALTPPDLLTRRHFAWSDMPQVFADASAPGSAKKLAPFRLLAQLFGVFGELNHNVAAEARKKLNTFLTRHRMTWSELAAIIAAGAAPLPSFSDPRDAAPHPFDDPAFNPASVVEGLVVRYATTGEHERVIYVLWVIFTHVHRQFAIAPRVALVSEEENSGKSILLEIARRLALRPNADNFSTGPAIIDHIDEGPGTVCADEIDLYDAEGLRWFKLIWNTGHWYLAKRALMVKGQRKVVNLHAPMIAAGVGDVFTRTQKSRTYRIEMQRYTAETKPARDYYADVVSSEPDAVEAIGGLDAAYTYLRQWAAGTRLNSRPVMPTEIITRYADNARGLIAVADACGPDWGQRARAAVMFFMRKDMTEHPKITIVRHGLAIFDALGVDFIRSTQFNRELKRLDLPDARWARYRGASNADYPHPLALDEQATLLNMVGIQSARHRHDGSRGRGYTRGQFEEAAHKYSVAPPDDADVARSRFRLISTASSD